MHVLVRGNLKTEEKTIISGPREASYKEEADALNQKHYERCYEEYFGKPANGNYTPNKRYIWFDKEIKIGGDCGAAILDDDGNMIGLLFADGARNVPS